MKNPFGDLGGVMKLLTPENMGLIQETIPKFIGDLRAALSKLLERSRHAESMQISLSNKIDFLISQVEAANERLILLQSSSNLSPEIIDLTIGQASADPRNQPGYVPPEMFNGISLGGDDRHDVA